MSEQDDSRHLSPGDLRSDLNRLGNEVLEMSRALKGRYSEIRILNQIMERVNAGLLPDEVMNTLYDTVRPIIPYQRICLLTIDQDQGLADKACVEWLRDDSGGRLADTPLCLSLQDPGIAELFRKGQPRIVTDVTGDVTLCDYDRFNELVLAGGMRTLLACPLIALGRPVGLIVLSHTQPGAYTSHHSALLGEIAGQLATVIEKSRLYRQLVKLNELKNRFLGIAAHDLRNPIGVIKGYLDLLAMEVVGPLNESQRDFVSQMEQTSVGMLNMINDLLDVSAIESGRLELRWQHLDICDWLRQFREPQALLARAKGITLELLLPQEAIPFWFDPERLEQVLTNLINNAIKFSDPQSTVTLSLERHDAILELRVADQGRGIPHAELPKLFNDFSRTSTRPTAGEKSTGLGLAIVKRLVTAHGGKVDVSSVVDMGTVFTVQLPLRERAPV